MSTFNPGIYKTKGGYKAIVTGLKTMEKRWFYTGAIECPSTLALFIHLWILDGSSAGHDEEANFPVDFDLTEEPWTGPDEAP